MRKVGLLFMGLCFTTFIYAQNAEIVALKQKLQNSDLSDTLRIDLLNEIALQLAESSPKEQLVYAHEAERLAKIIRYQKGIAEALLNFGVHESFCGDYPKARTYFEQVLQKTQNLPAQRAEAFCAMAYTYFNQSIFDQAQAYYDSAAVLADNLQLIEAQINVLHGYGIINIRLKNYAKAEEYLKKALEKSTKFEKKYYMALSVNSLGNVARYKMHYEEALDYYHKATLINQKMGWIRSQARTFSNIALTYEALKKFDEALNYHFEALKNFEKVDDVHGIAWYWVDAGRINLLRNELGQAEKNLLNGLAISEKMNFRNQQHVCYGLLSELYEKQQNFPKSLQFFKKYKAMTDSIYDTQKTKQINELQAKHENEQSEKENEILRKDNALKEKHAEQQTILFFSVLGLLFSFIIISIILFKNQQITQKTNVILHEKNREIELKNTAIKEQNAALHQKQQELIEQRNLLAEQKQKLEDQQYKLDRSIQSARTIQSAILPSRTRMRQLFNDYFVLYKPRDGVSGDFWWAIEQNHKKYLVVADCTGHGVPGALMTMIGNMLLNKIIRYEQLTDPAAILNQMHKEVHAALQQEETGSTEGMDMGIVIWEKNDEKNISLCYAGAKSILYYWHSQNKEVHRLDGVRKSVGGFYSEHRDFFNNSVVLPPNSIIYMCTDGYIDQNDHTRRRFGERRLYQSLISVADLPLEEQKQTLNQIIVEYAAGLDQRDDILFIGVKV